MDVTHLTNCPPDIDFYYNKHMIEQSLYEEVMRSEEAGYDAVIVGCLYDPGVRVARELVDIPVVGPLEASFQMAANFGDLHPWRGPTTARPCPTSTTRRG